MFEKGDEAANIVSKWTSGAGQVIAQAVFNRFPDYNQKCYLLMQWDCLISKVNL